MQWTKGKIKKKELIFWRITLVKFERIVESDEMNNMDTIGRTWKKLAIRAGYCVRSTTMIGIIIIKVIRFRRNC